MVNTEQFSLAEVELNELDLQLQKANLFQSLISKCETLIDVHEFHAHRLKIIQWLVSLNFDGLSLRNTQNMISLKI